MRSKRFLLVCHDAGGTVPPMLAIAEALIRSGHEVLLLSQPSVRLRAELCGCTFSEFSDIAAYEQRKSLEDQFALAWPVLTGRTVGDDVQALASRHRVDALVVDANLGGALAAAEALKQPSAVLLHSMYKTFVDTWFADYWPLFESAINETRAAYGLAPVDSWPSVFAGHDRLISVVPTVFDAPVADVPRRMRHFGFLVPIRSTVSDSAGDFPRGDAPTALVGLSTTYQAHEDLLQKILDALGGTAVRALVSTAGQIDVATLRVPANVKVTDFVAHAQVLGRTNVVVTHAGLGTVAAALTAGVPLVCTPISRDQPLNAQRVADVGAGVALAQDADAGHISAAIEQTLSDATYSVAADGLAGVSAREGGASAAAAELEALTERASPSD